MKLRIKEQGICSKPTDYMHPIREMCIQVLNDQNQIVGLVDNGIMAMESKEDGTFTFTMRTVDVKPTANNVASPIQTNIKRGDSILDNVHSTS